MTANRNVRTGLTASAVISVRSFPPDSARGFEFSLLIGFTKVMALEHCYARLHPRRIPIWGGGTILVCCRMQPHDCLLCASGHLLQVEDSGGTYIVGDRPYSIR